MPTLGGLSTQLEAISKLTPRQIYGHVYRRLRNRSVPHFANAYRRRLKSIADKFPPFDFAAMDRATPVAKMIADYYTAEYQTSFPGCYSGQFDLMNKFVDFGSIDRIDWAVRADEGTRQLRRSNLAQLGFVTTAALRDPEGALPFAAKLVRSFRQQARFESSRDFVEVWHPYIASRRTQSLCATLILAPQNLRNTPDWDEVADFARFNAAFVLENLEIDLGFNHLERNLAALAVFSLCTKTVAPEIAKTLHTYFEPIVVDSICDDGGPEERAAAPYHVLTLQSLRTFARLDIWSPEERAVLTGRLAKLEAALAILTLGDKEPVLFNDSWMRETPPIDTIVPLLGPGMKVLPIAGYVRLCDAEWVVVFDAGPIGGEENPGHGHADFLSIEATVGDARFIVDPGTYVYASGEVRDYLKSWDAHNGPVFVGRRPVHFIDAFKVGRRSAATLDRAETTADGTQVTMGSLAFEDVRTQRTVTLSPDGRLGIEDMWAGKGERRSRFLVPGEWKVAQEGERLVFSLGTRTVSAEWSGCEVAVRPSRWSRYYDIWEDAHEVIFTPHDDVQSCTYVFSVSAG